MASSEIATDTEEGLVSPNNSASTPAFLALAWVGFVASAPAFAAEEPETTRDRRSRRGRLCRRRIAVPARGSTNSKGPRRSPLVDTPRSIVVLPAQVIEETGSASLADALRTVPGITFGAAEGGNLIGDRPFIRGFDSQGSVFVDGRARSRSQTREVFDIDQCRSCAARIRRWADAAAPAARSTSAKLPVMPDFYSASASYGTDDYKRATFDVNRHIGGLFTARLTGDVARPGCRRPRCDLAAPLGHCPFDHHTASAPLTLADRELLLS